MTVSVFRRTHPGDLPIGLPMQTDVFDSVGRLVVRRGDVLLTLRERESCLSFGHWVRCGGVEGDGLLPFDFIRLSALHPFDALSCFHARLSSVVEGKRPLNWLDVLSELVDVMPELWTGREEHFLCGLAVGLHPSHALLNSIASAFFSDVCGKRLGLSEESRRSLRGAALSMNISLFALQDALSSEGRPPTPSERLAILRHPDDSADILQADGLADDLWLRVVRQHHEEHAGNGYPSKLVGDEISFESSILHFSDRLVAMISSRLRRCGLPLSEALSRMAEDGPSERRLSVAFSEEFGQKPAGRWYVSDSGDCAFSLGHLSSESFRGLLLSKQTRQLLSGDAIVLNVADFPLEIVEDAPAWPDGFWEKLRLSCST